jgi:hypothetical protein
MSPKNGKGLERAIRTLPFSVSSVSSVVNPLRAARMEVDGSGRFLV